VNFFKKLSKWMDELEKFNLEGKKMRREDRLGEVDYEILRKKDEQERNKLQKKQ